MVQTDRRDRWEPGEKEWQEFRTAYAAARLFGFLVAELEAIAPEYADTLSARLNEGIAIGDGYVEEDAASDGPAIISGPTSAGSTIMDLSQALLLEDELFPDRKRSDPRDLVQVMRGMAAVALHSALETYAKSRGAHGKGNLARSIKTFLHQRGRPIDTAAIDGIVNADATRHVLVHRAGVVDEDYLRQAIDCHLLVGEIRYVGDKEIDGWAHSIFSVAKALRIRRLRPLSNVMVEEIDARRS